MIKLYTTLFLLAISSALTAQSTVATSPLFDTTTNSTWTHVFTAVKTSDSSSGEAQTIVINVTTLPTGGANYRVYKTTANGGDYFGNAQALALGENTITVSGVSFDRAVKIQVNSGDIEFDAISVNDGSDALDVATSPLFNTGPNATWTHVINAALTTDGASSQATQNMVINVTTLPSSGANYRVYKTTANGSDFFGTVQALALGENTITVGGVSFDRAVKIQVSTGNIEFDNITLNSSANTVVLSHQTSSLFDQGTNSTYPNVFTAAVIADGASSQAEQTISIYVNELPPSGGAYRVYKTTANGSNFFGTAQALTLGQNTITVAGVSFNRTVKVQFGDNIKYDALSLNGSSVLSLDKMDNSSMTLYPNPVADMLSVSGIDNVASIKVYSIVGALIKEVKNTNTIDVSSLSTGLHIIEVNNGQKQMGKFIKK